MGARNNRTLKEPKNKGAKAAALNKKGEGIYAVVDMHCEPAAIKELDRQLNLNESVLRTKVIRPE